MTIGEEFVRGLLRQRLIPEDEFNDGLILAETSLAGIPMLVTSDSIPRLPEERKWAIDAATVQVKAVEIKQ